MITPATHVSEATNTDNHRTDPVATIPGHNSWWQISDVGVHLSPVTQDMGEESSFFAPQRRPQATGLIATESRRSSFFTLIASDVHELLYIPEPYRLMYRADDYRQPWLLYGRVDQGRAVLG